jgi:serine/threonine protein kinase/tetratricopeptide (TPR) repeat protein
MLAPGSRLGSYEIVAPLGAGGMGEVYAARDARLGRDLAIKLISSRRGVDAHTLARFTNEARSASALNHPNIVTIYEVDLDGEAPYIAMELIDGRDLRDLMRQGPLPMRRILDIATQTAEGLAAAHERGIVHRDLKPENIMVTRSGFVKILDFGLAKLTEEAAQRETTVEMVKPRTQSGAIVGTVGYMSPEQANGHPLDFRSDQFTLGTILYELTTMRPAFHRPTTVDTLSAIVHDDPEPIERLNGRAPAPFRWIIERCLNKDPEARYVSTRDLARELRTIRDRLQEATSSGEDFSLPEPRRGRVWILAAAAAGVIVTSVAVTMLLRDRDAEIRTPPAEASLVGTVARPRTVAVLPFQHIDELSGNASLVGDGFADALSGQLARYDSLQVMRPVDAELTDASKTTEIANELGADLVVRGAIHRLPNRVRVTWSLLDPQRGIQLAGATLDGGDTELFALQDRVADGLSTALRLKKTARESLSAEHIADRYLQALGYLQRYENEASVDGAISILTALTKEVRNAEVHAALGRAYLRKFQLTHETSWLEQAESACRTAVAIDDSSPDARITAGEALLARGRHPEAERELRSAVAQQPSSVPAHLALGDLYAASGNAKEAIQAYERAVEINPRYWASHNRLGVLLLTRGQARESIPHFQKVIDLTPDNIRGYNNLGAAHQQLGDNAKAIRFFEQSLAIRPNATAFTNLGTALFFEKQYDGAARNFERAVDLSPDSYSLWGNLADSYRWSVTQQTKERAALRKAIALAQAAVQVNARDAHARGSLALALAKNGELDRAKKEIGTALLHDPTNVMLLYNGAIIAHLAGDNDRARSHLADAMRLGLPKEQITNDPELRRIRI